MKRIALICMILNGMLCSAQLEKDVIGNMYREPPEESMRFKVARGAIYTGVVLVGLGMVTSVAEDIKKKPFSPALNPNYKEPKAGQYLLTGGSILMAAGVILALDYKKRPITYSLVMNEFKITYTF